MSKCVCIIGALDTKGQEYAFLKAEIAKRGLTSLVVDTGVLGEPVFTPDVSRAEVAAAGGSDLQTLVIEADRGHAMTVMAAGATQIVQGLHQVGKIDGIIAMGGGGGTSVATAAMRALPVGFPKLMVSTVASGDVGQYVGTTDIVMMPAVVDVAGLNRISRVIYTNAAGAIAGMVMSEVEAGDDKPLIAATMFGNTTRAVTHARQLLEAAGYEVLVFHATGTGGRTMEALVKDRYFVGVLDLTTTEWADELCGGVLSAGPHRLEAAGLTGIPQVVVPGCIDMCNFWARETVPAHYQSRTLYQWNPNITLMRTTPDETRRLGEIFAEKLNLATGPTRVYVPLGGVSEIDVEGQPFYSPAAIAAFVDGLKAGLREDIPLYERDTHINDPAFSQEVATALLQMLRS
jgi:uncharacterized protein (UPF0261 family)